MKRILIFLVGFFLIFSVFFNFITSTTRFLRDNCKARLMLSGTDEKFKTRAKNAYKNRDYSFFYHILKAIKSPQPFLSKNENWRIISKLEEVASVESSIKKRSVIYIPRSSEWFWASGLGDCSSLPFIVPAISGLAALRGGPLPSCQRFIFYGFENYDFSRNEFLLNFQKKGAVCREVTMAGFSKIITFDLDSDKQITRKSIDC
jgi:hypothetical protein